MTSTPATARPSSPVPEKARPRHRAPAWFIILTASLTLTMLFMAVAETTMWTHYLIDQGEYLSIVGLVFILAIGLYFNRKGELLASFPFFLPWLLYPVLTQADQIIDNLTMTQMRIVCHAILAILFAVPIAVLVLGAKHLLGPAGEPQRTRTTPFWMFAFPGLSSIVRGDAWNGAFQMTVVLLLFELWVAHAYLGSIMVATLVGLGVLATILFAARQATGSALVRTFGTPTGSRRLGLALLIVGVGGSFGLYLGFKNKPGAYQGSPHYYHDPSGAASTYALDRVIATNDADAGGPIAEEARRAIEQILTLYGDVLSELFEAYYILDRNYNYSFHNALFDRQTPVVPDFRKKGLARIAAARAVAAQADAGLDRLQLAQSAGIGTFLEDIRAYVAYSLGRAALLEELSGEMEQKQAGLQHCTHLYEGEGKVFGEQLVQILEKHDSTLSTPALADLSDPFVQVCHRVHKAYENRIVGF